MFIFLIFLLLSYNNCQAQHLFQKTFGTTAYEEIWGFDLTADSGFILAGYTGFGSAYLIKIDSEGNPEWSNITVINGFDLLYSVQQTEDLGFISAGRTNGDVLLIKTDSTGNNEWIKGIGGIGNETASAVHQTTDGGFILAGNTYSFSAGLNDFYLLKTDSAGNLVWSKTVGGTSNDNAYSIIQCANNDGYAAAGLTASAGNGSNDVLLVRLTNNGDVTWMKTYGGPGDDRANQIQQTIDGGFIIAGVTGSPGNYDFNLIKTDSSGNIAWAKTFGGGLDDWAYSVQQTTDTGYILTGYSNSYGGECFLIKTNDLGELLWAKTFGGPLPDYATKVNQTPDKGYAIMGYTESFGAGFYDFYLVKTDAAGNGICNQTTPNITVTSYTPIVTSPSLVISSGGIVTNLSGNVTPGTSVTTLCDSTLPCSSPMSFDYTLTNALPGINNGAVEVNVSGGQPPYLYSLDSMTFQSGNSFTELDTGTYKIYVTDNLGCRAQDTFTISQVTGVATIKSQDAIIFPNPFTNQLTIHMNPFSENNICIKFTDVFGKIIGVNQYERFTGNELLFNTLNIPVGVYFLHVLQNGKSIAYKLVKADCN